MDAAGREPPIVVPRSTSMRADAGVELTMRGRAARRHTIRVSTAAALLACLVAFTFAPTARRTIRHRHVTHAAAVLTLASGDSLHWSGGADQHPDAAPATAAAPGGLPVGAATGATSRWTQSHTTHSTRARGPPWRPSA
ncbi:MAG: hypothetical protein ACR2LX_02355 [Jatrophihabitans sp.]